MFEPSYKQRQEQKQIAKALRNREVEKIKEFLTTPNNLTLFEVLDLYRSNYQSKIYDALIETYPKLFLLFANDFDKIAMDFIEKYNAHAYALMQYCGNFPEFMNKSDWAKHHPEVYDMANLEHCFNLLYHAQDSIGAKLDTPELDEDAEIELVQNLYIFNSKFPIHDWWKTQSIKSNKPPTPFFIYKNKKDIGMYYLSAFQHKVLSDIVMGETLRDSVNQAMKTSADKSKKNEISSLLIYLSSERLIANINH